MLAKVEHVDIPTAFPSLNSAPFQTWPNSPWPTRLAAMNWERGMNPWFSRTSSRSSRSSTGGGIPYRRARPPRRETGIEGPSATSAFE